MRGPRPIRNRVQIARNHRMPLPWKLRPLSHTASISPVLQHPTITNASNRQFVSPTRPQDLGLRFDCSTQTRCPFDHVRECQFDLLPASGLQSAIGIDPELLRRKNLQGLVQQVFYLSILWNARRVDIIDAGTYSVGVADAAA